MRKRYPWNKVQAGRSRAHRRPSHIRPLLQDDGTTPLCQLPAGYQSHIHTVRGGHTFTTRMATFGFTPGTPVEVLQNYGQGPIIVRVRGSRVALGRQEARRILVEALKEKPEE